MPNKSLDELFFNLECAKIKADKAALRLKLEIFKLEVDKIEGGLK